MKLLDRPAIKNAPEAVTKASPPSLWRKYLLIAGEIFVCALLVVVVLESLLAFAGLGEEEYLRMEPVIGWVPMEGKHFTHRGEGFSRASFSSLGMPDIERTLKKPAGVFRIALIGDSFTEGFSVHPDRRFGNLLENRLNSEFPDRHFEVLNFGVPAYNIAQKYLRLKTFALQFDPDLVLMQLRPKETLVLGPGELKNFDSAKPIYALDGSGQLTQDLSQQVRWNKSAEGRRMRDTYWLRRHSHIWGVIAQQMQSLAVWQRQTDRHFKRMLHGKGFDVFARAVPGASAGAAQAKQWDVALKYLFPLGAALIGECKKESEQHGAGFALIYFPAAPGTQSELERKLFRESSLKSGINYLDLTSQFEAFPPVAQKKLYCQYHLSNQGNQLAADKIFDYLNTQGLVK